METTLNTATLHENLKILAEELQAKYQYSQNVSLLELNSGYGKGVIKAISFNTLATLINIEAKFSNSLHLNYFSHDQYHPLKMIYSFKNSFYHSVYNHKIEYNLKAKTASLSAGYGKDHHSYLFSENTDYRISIIELNRNKYLEKMDIKPDELPDDLRRIFETGNGDPFFFLFHNHYRLEEGFDELIKTNTKDLTAKIFLEAKMLGVAAYILKLYEDRRFNRDVPENYTTYDLNQLNSARLFLKENFKDAPTIKELAKEVALNDNKLKNGFKELFNTTIYQFIVDQKMKFAREMIDNDRDISIKEVADEVGYINKSQFAKRFQRHFGMLPREYRNSNK